MGLFPSYPSEWALDVQLLGTVICTLLIIIALVWLVFKLATVFDKV